MKSNRLVEFYDRLTASERFRLLFEAATRGDDEEIDRLTETSPRKHYTLLIADITNLLGRSVGVMAWLTGRWLEVAQSLAYCVAAKTIPVGIRFGLEVGFAVGLAAAERVPNETDPFWEVRSKKLRKFDAMCEKAEQEYREAVARVKGVDAGLQRFCEAIALEPQKLLALHPVVREIEEMRERLEADIPADEEEAEAVYRGLRELWPERTGTAKGNGR